MKPSRRFPPELLQKIKSAVNLVEVIGEHVVLRKSGANHSGLCPFHSERTPSFSVSEPKQLYHCYGCKKSGDIITFLQDLHGLDFYESIEELAERGKIKLPAEWDRDGSAGDNPEARKKREEQQKRLATMYKTNRFVAAFYHQQLAQAPAVAGYFRKRGIGEELIRSFYLGAAPAAWESLASHLKSAQAPMQVAADLGLIRPSTRNAAPGGTGFFDLFRNRAVFPILDLRGRVCGFGGRVLPGSADGEPKYLNSAESVVFQKSRLAFGLFQAQKHIREKDEVILVEGYFDVLALHAAGFQNVVASCGTALTPEHLALFRKFASKVTVLFDGDEAGIDATERAMEVGLENGFILQGAVLPEGMDPDELLFDQETGQTKPGGRERMASILGDAQALLDVRLDEAIEDAARGPEAKSQAIKRIGRWLAKYTDRVGREVRVQYVQERLKVGRDLLGASKGSGAVRRPMPEQPSRVSPARRVSSPLRPTERTLLQALARGGKAARWVTEAVEKLPTDSRPEDLFESGSAREFAGFWISRLQTQTGGEPLPAMDSGALSELSPGDPIRAVLVEALFSEPVVSEGDRITNEEEIHMAVGRGVALSWARFSQRIKVALADAEAKKDAGLQQKLMKEYLDVQRKMKEFSSFYDEA